MFNFPVLVGDIGGTNARLAIIIDGHSNMIQFDAVKVADYKSIIDLIQSAALDKTSHWPRTMILAIAAPLGNSESYYLTNAKKEINPVALLEYFNLDQLVVMNDFAGQALAAVALDQKHIKTIGSVVLPDQNDFQNEPKVILGAGTGLGVANAIKARKSWIVLPGEGGHVDLGPSCEREFAIWGYLEKTGGRVSAEQVLCGRGLCNLYQAIAKANGNGLDTTPDEARITSSALDGSDPVAVESCKMFVSLLGRVAGDLALITMARGGIYVAGGIAMKMMPLFETGAFREAFERKAPHDAFMKEIPASVITHPTAALEGLASYAQKPDLYIMDQAIHIYNKA